MRLAGFIQNSISNGKGIRSVVFVQGCPHHCKGCHNQHTWDFDLGAEKTVEEVFDMIKNEMPLINGVTFSGGEPMCQAKELIELSKLIKSETDLDIWCYTGCELDQLSNRYQKELLNYIDVLVTGQFKEELKQGSPRYVGSCNQQIINLKGEE